MGQGESVDVVLSIPLFLCFWTTAKGTSLNHSVLWNHDSLEEEQLRKVSHRICVTDSGITMLSREVQAANALCLIRVARLVIMPTPSMIWGNAMTLCAITYSSQGFISFVFFCFHTAPSTLQNLSYFFTGFIK